jgi:hypothetical protein
MEYFMLQTLVITFIACATALITDAIASNCARRPVYDNWKPFGLYKGHVVYERVYDSGKKSWRYEDKDGDGHIYMGAATVQNENITPF